MPAAVVQGAADIAVVHTNPVGIAVGRAVLDDIHRVMVVGQAGHQGGIVVDVPGGLVGDPGAAGLVAVGVDTQVVGGSGAWVMFDLRLGQAARYFVLGLAITQVE